MRPKDVRAMGADEHAHFSVPDLGPGSAADLALCALAALIVLWAVRLPLHPGSAVFFAAQAALWGFASGFYALSRRRAWQALHGGAHGDPRGWPEAMPAWAFESTAWTQVMVFPPFAVAMAVKIFSDSSAFIASCNNTSKDAASPGDFWLEHLIYGCLTGFMVRDMLMHIRDPHPLFTVHHIAVCVLMVSVCFFEVPGFSLLAFVTAVVELGSCSFCLYGIYRCRRLYTWMMTLSNIIWVLGASATLLGGCSRLQCCMAAIGVTMAAARQLYLFRELRLADSKTSDKSQ